MATVKSKACSICKQILPAAAFTADRRASSGLQPQCKSCRASIVKERRRSNPEAVRAYLREYRRKHPDKCRQWHERNKAKNGEKIKARARAYYLRNRERHIEWVREDRRANPERTREWARGWQARRRALKSGGVSPATMRAWMAAQEKVCRWCGVPCADNFHVDHIMALSKGGPHEIHNLCIACPPCNLSKGAKDCGSWQSGKRVKA